MKKKLSLIILLFFIVCIFATEEPMQLIFEEIPEDSTPQIDSAQLALNSSQTVIIPQKPDYVPLDIPYNEHALIDKHRAEFMTNFGETWLAEVLETAAVYRPHVRQQLAEYGLPQCLEFLPIIESNYNTYAISRSGATGIWQFMENSIAGLLEKNDWLDERRDPWRSTEAAAKKLLYNYNYFKNWELALAAYNMGVGGLNKVIKEAGSNDYWYLVDNGYLRSETKNYVPKFLAVADLVTNAEYYGLDIPSYDSATTVDFTELTLNKQINLEILATDTGIEYEMYRFLNPALEYAVTPPASYTLRIPEGSESIIAKALPEQNTGDFAQTYKVKQGDTLWSLSIKYGTTVENLCAINKRSADAVLSIGTVLFLPILK